MRRIRSLLYCVVAALGVLGWASSANAQAQRVGTCLETITTAGANQCTDYWQPLLLNGLTNTAVAIKATGGVIGKVYCYNPNASVAYIQLFNVAAASVVVGTTKPLASYGIAQANGEGINLTLPGDGFPTAISAAVTTTATGGTAPSSAMDCNVSFN